MILLTATGGRPECTALLVEYMARQTYAGPRYWLVVDDCDPPTPVPGATRIIRPAWRWQPGTNTGVQNHRLLLEEARRLPFDKLLIVQDDEWYGPDFLAVMNRALDDRELVGEYAPRYYCVRTRTYRIHDRKRHRRHSCLCRTGLRRGRLWDKLESLLDGQDVTVDRALWANESTDGLLRQRLSVGIKGMPGRTGIGGGHDGHPKYRFDPDLKVLREWIGRDADQYAGYYRKAAA